MEYFVKIGKEIKEITEDEIKEYSVYGVKTQERGHTFTKHNVCGVDNCVICNIDVCMVCIAYEGDLTTHCSGENVTMDRLDRVYEGKEDFIFGRWVKGVTNRVMIKDIETVYENHNILLKEFGKEIRENTELGKEIEEYIKIEKENWESVK